MMWRQGKTSLAIASLGICLLCGGCAQALVHWQSPVDALAADEPRAEESSPAPRLGAAADSPEAAVSPEKGEDVVARLPTTVPPTDQIPVAAQVGDEAVESPPQPPQPPTVPDKRATP